MYVIAHVRMYMPKKIWVRAHALANANVYLYERVGALIRAPGYVCMFGADPDATAYVHYINMWMCI